MEHPVRDTQPEAIPPFHSDGLIVVEESRFVIEERKRKRRILGLSALLIAVAVAVGAAVWIFIGIQGSNSQQSNSIDIGDAREMTLSPSLSPTVDLFSHSCYFRDFDGGNGMSGRFMQLLSMMDTKVPETTQLIENSMSIYRISACWLADFDEFQVGTTNFESHIMMERFVLALLYFRLTDVNNWDNDLISGKWLTGEHHCNWGFVSCTDTSMEVTRLYLHNVALSGNIPTELSLLTKLEVLVMSTNDLSGKIPSELWSLTGLRHLSLSGNKLTGTISEDINNLALLVQFDIGHNSFTGTLPSVLVLPNLMRLELTYSDIGGPLPDISMSTNLVLFEIVQCDMTGTLPDYLGNLTNLETLSLSSTNLSGTIPTEIGLLKSLVLLDLDYTRFVGTIPSEIGQLPHIKTIDIDPSQFLTGTVPTELCSLPSLARIRVDRQLLSSCDCCSRY